MQEAYRTHMAHVMAIALSRLTGLPLGLLAREAATTTDYGHAVVIVDADRPAWLDVDGLHIGLGAAAFRFKGPIDRVVIVPATEENVAMAFGDAHPSRLLRRAKKVSMRQSDIFRMTLNFRKPCKP